MAKVGCNALFDHIERFNGELDPQDSIWEPMSRPRRQKRRSKPKRRRQPCSSSIPSGIRRRPPSSSSPLGYAL